MNTLFETPLSQPILINSTVGYFLQSLAYLRRADANHAKPAYSKRDRTRYISEIRRKAAMHRWHPECTGDANADFASPRARSSSSLRKKEEELEKELEKEEAPQQALPVSHPSPKSNHQIRHKNHSRRQWVDRDTARAAGADRYWAARVGEIYWLAKDAFLTQHPSRRMYFWSRLDALQLGQFLERRPGVTLEDVRALLINYHASERTDRAGSASVVFPVLQDYAVLNPVRQASKYRHRSTSRSEEVESRLHMAYRKPTTPEEIAAAAERDRRDIEDIRTMWPWVKDPGFEWDPAWGPEPEKKERVNG